MPLYKKTTSKARVKTQNSFISPLLSQMSTTQNKIKDLIKDDYKENLPIPTKKKVLESLINIANDGELLDKLQQKPFKNSSKTFIEVSNSKESWSKKDRDETTKVGNKSAPKKWAKTSSKDKKAKFKELSNTVSDLSAQSPLLFNSRPPSSIEGSNKRLKTENSMTVTTKIEISSNTDGDIFNIKKANEVSTFQLSDLVNDCVMNNLKMSEQFLNQDNSVAKTNTNTSGIKSMQNSTSKMEEDEDELDASLRSILDEVVNSNIMLSQKIEDDGVPFETTKIKIPEKKQKKIKDLKLEPRVKSKIKEAMKITEKSKKHNTSVKTLNSSIEDEERKTNSPLRSILDDVVNENIILSQEMKNNENFLNRFEKNTKKNRSDKEKKKNKKEFNNDLKNKKENLKEATEKSKENLKTLSKSKENTKSLSKTEMKSKQLKKDVKTKLFKKIRALCSEEDVPLEKSVISKVDSKESKLQKYKSTDAAKKLKQNIKEKYLIEKQKSTKSKNEKTDITVSKDRNERKKKNEMKEKAEDFGKGGKKSGYKKLERRGSFSITKPHSSPKNKARFPPKPRNMIFTSKNPETNEMQLNKLLQLQEERDIGLYVYCDTCDKVRYLQHCKDPLDLPAKWYCYMNPDPNYNKCSDPDFEIEPEKEELIIFNKFNAGSIIWAKMDGYPWWPAMIDDDPDLTDYFWLDDENSLEPSWYHVTFFDSSDVTRAWIKTASLQPFEINAKNPQFKPNKYNCYRHRIEFAMREAKTACKMEVLERLRLYSFATRYFKKHNETLKKEKKNRLKKSKVTKGNQNLTDDNKGDKSTVELDTNKDVVMFETHNSFGNLSIASSEIITDILKSKKPGKYNRIASDDAILENIDFNHFICNEDNLGVDL